MTSWIDGYFLYKIERALDDGEPLGGWTAWYVRRRPELRHYYESMLEMEIELRFAEDMPQSLENTWSQLDSSVEYSQRENRRVPVLGRRNVFRFGAAAAVILLLCLCVLVWSKRSGVSIETGPISGMETALTNGDSKIDLGELVSAFMPASNRDHDGPDAEKTSFGTFFGPLSVDLAESLVPTESIIRFSENPLEKSLAFLETVHVVRERNTNSKNHPN